VETIVSCANFQTGSSTHLVDLVLFKTYGKNDLHYCDGSLNLDTLPDT